MSEEKRPNIFFIMPLNKEIYPKSLEFFERLKERFKEKYEFKHASTDKNHRNIMKDVVQGLKEANVVVADLSTLNANVFYELGVAHAFNKKVICVRQKNEKLPFDISMYRANEYNPNMDLPPVKVFEMSRKPGEIDKLLESRWPDFSNLCNNFEECLEGAVNGTSKSGNSVEFSNPVHDSVEDIERTFFDVIVDRKIGKYDEDWSEFFDLLYILAERCLYRYQDFSKEPPNDKENKRNFFKTNKLGPDTIDTIKRYVHENYGIIDGNTYEF